jgi:hypothetical protein
MRLAQDALSTLPIPNAKGMQMDASTTESVSWFYEIDGQRKGPITQEAIIILIMQGTITYGMLVWKAGFPEWLKVEDSELRAQLERVAPPPITGKHIGNGVVWILAFAPIIGYFLETAFSYVVNNSDTAADAAMTDSKYWFITLALNIGLSYFDEGRLQRAGYDTSKFKAIAWFVPGYLYKRAKALNQSLGYFVVWMVCFVLTLLS